MEEDAQERTGERDERKARCPENEGEEKAALRKLSSHLIFKHVRKASRHVEWAQEDTEKELEKEAEHRSPHQAIISKGVQFLRRIYDWGTEHERLTILVSAFPSFPSSNWTPLSTQPDSIVVSSSLHITR